MRRDAVTSVSRDGQSTSHDGLAPSCQTRPLGVREYQDVITPSSPLQCGLPQIRLSRPYSSCFYTEPIYRLGNLRGRIGYAEDTGVLCVGDSLETHPPRFNAETAALPHKLSSQHC